MLLEIDLFLYAGMNAFTCIILVPVAFFVCGTLYIADYAHEKDDIVFPVEVSMLLIVLQS